MAKPDGEEAGHVALDAIVVEYPGPKAHATKRRAEEARRQADNNAMLATKETHVDKEVMTNEETRGATVRTFERTARAATNVAKEGCSSIPDEHDATDKIHQDDERVRRRQRPVGINSQRAVSTITRAEAGSSATRPLDTAKGRMKQGESWYTTRT
ncbi:hypothetical protein GN244_ATG08382 [Phytophthora infestans]|uniref:Uncharacterized protein n=1 Tax=Phytophthora infestans TaxID=4787 RepID=A0A833SXP2_PHYIN|nr:hypothetical protein GN244_ATG08382 [Phytophthora infestans]